MAFVELLQLGDESLIFFLGTNDRGQFARQQTTVALWIHFEHGVLLRFRPSPLRRAYVSSNSNCPVLTASPAFT